MQVFIEPFNLSFFSIIGWGIDLDYCDIEWFALERNKLSVLKSRDITLPTKVRLVKAMVFPVVMYGFESWTIKKAEHQRTDALKLWC